MINFDSYPPGLPPAYLADGQTAYKATIVASWPAHNRARFSTCLYTREQLEQAGAAEHERLTRCVENVSAQLREVEARYAALLKDVADSTTLLRPPPLMVVAAPKGTFSRGDLVRKRSGSAWVGRVVGEYSTNLTPEGYAVESDAHPGSVQIYPAAALELIQRHGGPSPRMHADP